MKKRKTLRNILIALGAITTICIIALLIGRYIITEATVSLGEWLSYDGGCLEWWGGPEDPAAIEIGAHLTLPPSTERLFAHSVAFQDCFVFVSFDMASSELETFLTSTYVSELDSVTGSPLSGNLLQNEVDWTFDPEKTYLYGSGSSEGGGSSQYIVIDPTGSGTYTVYVVTFLS